MLYDLNIAWSPSTTPDQLLQTLILSSSLGYSTNYRLGSLVAAYDILAIRPLTDKAFQNACLTLDVPIISMDFTQHFQFHFRPKPCMAAVTRGVRFEVCYSQALAADARGRANFISNVTSLRKGNAGLGAIPRSIVVNEGIKRSGFRGVIDVVEVAKRDEDQGNADEDGKKASDATGKKKNKGQNQKRKSDGEDAQPMSKRQAKKMKLASRGAGPDKK
ncbi:RNA-binding RNA processing protein rpp1 [Fusarium falciforme]|nr:RNA-binding RNA processing protein rpp1 [Fusarium falciforme]